MKKTVNYLLLTVSFMMLTSRISARSKNPDKSVTDNVIAELKTKYPQADPSSIERGVENTARFWNESDGNDEQFKNFCFEYYEPSPEGRKLLTDRYRSALESVYGRFGQASTKLQYPIHVDDGPLSVVDELFASWSPFTHLDDDWFGNKLAHILHLNFPFRTLEECYASGDVENEPRAEISLGKLFSSRIPAELRRQASITSTRSEMYIADYNIFMNNIVDEKGEKHFPENLKLISHWGLRDELKARYADNSPEGLLKQKLIYDLMIRIINQEIPAVFINNPNGGEYCPATNKLTVNGKPESFEPENDVRYAFLLENFKIEKSFDPYCPLYPDAVKRAFDQGLEMTPDEIEKMFVSLLSAPVNNDLGKLIAERLGRPLQPYDIWYDGFKPRSAMDESVLTKKTSEMFPDAKAFEKRIPEILQKAGYSEKRALEIGSKIAVDPARGSGHAMGASIKGDLSRLRARFPKTGLDYSGYNIAMHELGHNVEQTISLYDTDDYLTGGIPNTAFTEALAFVFQKRDLEVLGFKSDDRQVDAGTTLDIYWGCCEIAGVALVDLYVWRYMYENPDITPSRLKQAVIDISKDVWNKYYAPVFGLSDSPILGIYSHMISYPLYLTAYPLGHLIEFQLEQHLKGKNFADEIDRIYSIGNRPPKIWMQKATGQNPAAEPIIEAAGEALKIVK